MKKSPTYQFTLTAILAALALALAFLEGLLPPLPIPGARLGLANLAVMYALTAVSLPSAMGITAVKTLFALLRGPVPCLMSLAGGTLALIGMALLQRFVDHRLSFIGLGVIGAAAHNIGQLLVSVALLGHAMWYYTPILLFMAVPAGIVTGLVLNITYPYFRQISK